MATIPPVPLESAALRTWAQAHGVAAEIDQPVHALGRVMDGFAHYRLTYGPPITLHDLLVSDRKDLPFPRVSRSEIKHIVGQMQTALSQLARQRAEAKQLEESKVARWARARPAADSLPAPLPALTGALLELRARLRPTIPLPLQPRATRCSFELSRVPLAISVTGADEGQAAYWSRWRVTLDLTSWPAPPPPPTCAQDRRPCSHQLDALEALLDLLLTYPDQARRLDASWLADLARPAWDRFLAGSASGHGGDGETDGVSETASAEQLLTWKICPLADGVAIEPTQHKRLRTGGWSKGSKVPPEKALSHPGWHTTPADAAALEMLSVVTSLGSFHPSVRRLRRRVIEALVGHPHLVLDNEGRQLPLRLEHAEFSLRVEETPTGELVPTPLVGGSTALAQQALAQMRLAPFALVIEAPPEAEVAAGYLVHSDARVSELLRSIETYRPQIPLAAAPQLMARLGAVGERVQLELPASLAGEEVAADAEPILRLRLTTAPGAAAALELEAAVRPLAEGPTLEPGQGALEISRFEGSRRLRARRDPAAEEAAAAALLGRLPLERAESPSRWQRRLGSLDEALDLVGHLQTLPKEGPGAVRVEWLEAPAVVTRQAQPTDLRVRVTDERDWFGLDGEVEIDGERVQLALLLEAVRRQARYIEVGPRRWISLSRELRDRLGGAADVVHPGRRGLEVSPVAADALADLLGSARELELSARWRGLVKRLGAARARTHAVPRTIAAQLRPYQEEGFVWLMRLAECGMGAVLADDMGLGKTLQALALLDARSATGPALVIAPTSVCFNWQREAKRFAPALEVIRYHGPTAERGELIEEPTAGEVVITSYGLLVEDAERFQKVPWATLVLDEAQALKNAATHRARAVRDLKAGWAVALTGTPVENHVGELWSLFRAVAPGLLGSWEQFRERFANPIEKYRDPARRAALARLVRPFILRRTKDAVARELPARTEIQLPVTLSRSERRLYDDARLAAVARLTGAVEGKGEDARFEVLAALTRLRQLACHPRLYDPDSTERSSKLERLLDLVDELREEGHRALVFSQFTSHLALVRQTLDARRIAYRYLDGSTPPRQREAEVDAFQAGQGDLFLISLKAGGTGLNLTAADYVIHLDPWWNPAVEDQATDRAHRIGQTKPVTVYRLVTQGTIEEAILALHADKRDLVAGLLDGTDRAGKLSTEQLVELIRSGGAPHPAEEDDAASDSPTAGASVQALERAAVAVEVAAAGARRGRAMSLRRH